MTPVSNALGDRETKERPFNRKSREGREAQRDEKCVVNMNVANMRSHIGFELHKLKPQLQHFCHHNVGFLELEVTLNRKVVLVYQEMLSSLLKSSFHKLYRCSAYMTKILELYSSELKHKHLGRLQSVSHSEPFYQSVN